MEIHLLWNLRCRWIVYCFDRSLGIFSPRLLQRLASSSDEVVYILLSEMMRYYYQFQIAGYIFQFLLLPFEPKQTATDILALSVHHSSTLFLLWNSYIYSFHRIGIVIALLHDLSDPFMEIAKVTLYSGRAAVDKVN